MECLTIPTQSPCQVSAMQWDCGPSRRPSLTGSQPPQLQCSGFPMGFLWVSWVSATASQCHPSAASWPGSSWPLAGHLTDVLLIFKGKHMSWRKESTTIWLFNTSPWEMAHKNAHCFIATVYLLKILNMVKFISFKTFLTTMPCLPCPALRLRTGFWISTGTSQAD